MFCIMGSKIVGASMSLLTMYLFKKTERNQNMDLMMMMMMISAMACEMSKL